jgi:hypothetical protein
MHAHARTTHGRTRIRIRIRTRTHARTHARTHTYTHTAWAHARARLIPHAHNGAGVLSAVACWSAALVEAAVLEVAGRAA